MAPSLPMIQKNGTLNPHVTDSLPKLPRRPSFLPLWTDCEGHAKGKGKENH